MHSLLLRWAIGAFSLWIASALIPGMEIQGLPTFFLAAVLLGFANAVVRPLFILFTLPLTILSLGLFLLIINAAMLSLVARLLEGFTLSGFGAAFLGSILVSLTNTIASWYVGARETERHHHR